MGRKEKVEKLVKDWFAKTADYEWKYFETRRGPPYVLRGCKFQGGKS